MIKTYSLPGFVVAYLFVFSSCEIDPIEPQFQYYTPEELEILSASLNLPPFPYSYGSGFTNNLQPDDRSTLGRVLFYDKKLSLDNTVSCGSCHQQQLGFADDVAFSTGIMNRTTARNSLALGAFSSFSDYSGDPETTLFWDGRVNTLEDQMIQTIRNPNEMGMELRDIADRINQFDYYRVLTQKAYGQDQLDSFLIMDALSQFMNSIQSNSSKFDKAVLHIGLVAPNLIPPLSTKEEAGLTLFFSNCVQCHSQGMSQSNFNPNIVRDANNGLDLVYTDKGAGELDPSPEKLAIFKVPGLKNIALTAPYMHDGRFGTLEEVIHFYSNGIQDHPNLHPLLKQNGLPKRFNFTENQVSALVAFLKTLTDINMTQEVKWSDPFK